jgi:diacylglycerol kinase
MHEHWIRKFANALSGVRTGIVGQSSFCVHLPAALLVIILAWMLRCQVWQWCLLILCIGLVISLELLNSALECLAKGLCNGPNEQVGRALDIAAGSVLIASVTAATVGLTIFVMQLLEPTT